MTKDLGAAYTVRESAFLDGAQRNHSAVETNTFVVVAEFFCEFCDKGHSDPSADSVVILVFLHGLLMLGQGDL